MTEWLFGFTGVAPKKNHALMKLAKVGFKGAA
jgi:hypothetical protein